MHAVVGPNGAGKSTLAHTIMGLSGYTDFASDILFEGESLKGLTIHQRACKGITMAWQEPACCEGLTVESFISITGHHPDIDAVVLDLPDHFDGVMPRVSRSGRLELF